MGAIRTMRRFYSFLGNVSSDGLHHRVAPPATPIRVTAEMRGAPNASGVRNTYEHRIGIVRHHGEKFLIAHIHGQQKPTSYEFPHVGTVSVFVNVECSHPNGWP